MEAKYRHKVILVKAFSLGSLETNANQYIKSEEDNGWEFYDMKMMSMGSVCAVLMFKKEETY